jgi:hypothetical protein
MRIPSCKNERFTVYVGDTVTETEMTLWHLAIPAIVFAAIVVAAVINYDG